MLKYFNTDVFALVKNKQQKNGKNRNLPSFREGRKSEKEGYFQGPSALPGDGAAPQIEFPVPGLHITQMVGAEWQGADRHWRVTGRRPSLGSIFSRFPPFSSNSETGKDPGAEMPGFESWPLLIPAQ